MRRYQKFNFNTTYHPFLLNFYDLHENFMAHETEKLGSHKILRILNTFLILKEF